ncbi:MAG TPA: cytochrome c biogenesis protein CcdA [Verrucomicrobiae bacterium]|nr:cytochrome c biogenesis protein CcdA [Verrucomicrobiae bacterium]
MTGEFCGAGWQPAAGCQSACTGATLNLPFLQKFGLLLRPGRRTTSPPQAASLPHKLLPLILLTIPAFAQTSASQWSVEAMTAAAPPGGHALLRVTAKIDTGWHLYSGTTPFGQPTTFKVGPDSIVDGVRMYQPPPKRAFDKVADNDTETYVGEAAFVLDVAIKKNAAPGDAQLDVNARYQTCNDTQCLPGKWSGTVAVKIDPAAAASAAIPDGYKEAVAPKASGAAPADTGLAAFIFVAFGFGLLSIFTPCVFPMIPITMSYFLNRQSSSRRDGVVQAVVFCLGIIVLFTGLGLGASAILGPAGVKNLGASPWVNGFIAALFIAFGLSLLGAFEITIPSPILTKLNQSSNAGGFIGTLLMGLTFALSSFACVGPFVGTLLAGSVEGGALRPLIGMAVFATGLALPFFLLALFPSYLKRLPKSGGWLARVKIVMGFMIVAFSLVYLAKLDQTLGWGLVTRGRFLAAWVVLFAMAGLYLLGFLRMEGVKSDESVGLGRLITGIVLLIFAISLLPGMFGGNLGNLEAFVPMASEQAGGFGGSGGGDALVWMKDQYREALAKAKAEGKLVFIDFTGYNCANCHWMRGNILNRPEIVAELKKFVLVELYTDGVDAASEANSKLQLEKFGTVAEPLYVILDPEEHVIARFDHLTHDPAEFLAFLQTAKPAAASPQPETAIGPFTKLDGRPFDVAALKDKVVVVNFWATYCVPCIAEFPSFNKIYRDLGPKGVAVVGVDVDADAAGVPGFLKKHPIEYSVAVGGEAAMQQYKFEGPPVTIVYDRSGKQVQRFDGGASEAELRAAVEKALQ